MKSIRSAGLLFVLVLVCVSSCAHFGIHRSNPYESSKASERKHFKKVGLPFLPGTQFRISQGAFGSKTHHEPGHEYRWDFDVPYGTPVIAVADGTVLEVWEPGKGGSCDSSLSDYAHNIKIEHRDGTIAQYTHVASRVQVGGAVKRGELVALTAKNGFICRPQLDFAIFRDRKSIPVLFEGVPEGLAFEGLEAKVPENASSSP